MCLVNGKIKVVPINFAALDRNPAGSAIQVRRKYLMKQLEKEKEWNELRRPKNFDAEMLKRKLASFKGKRDVAAKYKTQINRTMDQIRRDDALNKEQTLVRHMARQQLTELLELQNVSNPLSEQELNQAVSKIVAADQAEGDGVRRSRRISRKMKSDADRRVEGALRLVGTIGVQTFGSEKHVFIVTNVDSDRLRKWAKQQRGQPPNVLTVVYPPQHTMQLWDKAEESVAEVRACALRYRTLVNKGAISAANQKAFYQVSRNVRTGVWKEDKLMFTRRDTVQRKYNLRSGRMTAALLGRIVETAFSIREKTEAARRKVLNEDNIEGVVEDYAMRISCVESRTIAKTIMQEEKKKASEKGLGITTTVAKSDDIPSTLRNNGDGTWTYLGKGKYKDRVVDFNVRSNDAVVDGSWNKVSRQKCEETRWKWFFGTRREDESYNQLSRYTIIDRSQVPSTERILKIFRIVNYKSHEPPNSLKRFKVRNVADGSRQQMDLSKTFSAVARDISIRCLFALAGWLGCSTGGCFLSTSDMRSAFLSNDLPEDLDGNQGVKFMEPPIDFYSKSGRILQPGTRDIIRLTSSVYGLKDASRILSDNVRKLLEKLGYQNCEHDQSIYFKFEENGVFSIVGTYVDDFIMLSSSKQISTDLVKTINDDKTNRMELTLHHNPSRYCGYNLTYHEEGGLSIDVNDYCETIIKKFATDKGITLKNRSLPGDPSIPGRMLELEAKTTKEAGGLPREVLAETRKMLGSVLYLCGKAHPLIAPIVNMLATTGLGRGKLWTKQFYHLLGYLQQDLNDDPGIFYRERRRGDSLTPKIDGLSDASFFSTREGRSLGGYIILYGGAAVAWRSSLSKTICLSTTEAEAAANSELTRELLWLGQWQSEMGFDVLPMHVGIDNLAALRSFVTGSGGKGSRHTTYKIQHLRACIKDGLIIAQHVGTHWNLADPLSKLIRLPSVFNWMKKQIMTVRKK